MIKTESYFITKFQLRIENYLNRFLSFADSNTELTEWTELLEAIRYSVLNGGKRIRPLLVYVFGEALGAKTHELDVPAAAIELIHCYSLIHDDLPAMDNDDLRRGKPSCHKAFSEATAILAGDALQSLAFELLSDERRNSSFTSAQQIKMIQILAKASGIMGMVGGQSLDISLSNKQFSNKHISNKQVSNKHILQNPTMTLDLLKTLHQKKTAALIQASVQLAALVSGCQNTKILALLQNYAENLGLAFQVQDDILDVEGSAEILGKNIGQDAALQKFTFTEVLGLKGSKIYMQELYKEALSYAKTLNDEYGIPNNSILELTTFLLQRHS